MDDQAPEKRTTSSDNERYEDFVRLLVEHEPRVRSFPRGLMPTWHDVEEVTQEARLVAWGQQESSQADSNTDQEVL